MIITLKEIVIRIFPVVALLIVVISSLYFPPKNCREPLMNCCPVCGEVLDVSDRLNTMIHLTLCFDEGSGNQIMTGGFLTDKQASSG